MTLRAVFAFIVIMAQAMFLSACVHGMNATTVAAPHFDFADEAGLKYHALHAAPFTLTTFESVSLPGGHAAVYIENDGGTPADPTALRLAAADPSANVFWLARACQYSAMEDNAPCPDTYVTTGKFTPEVVDAMNRALDDIKQRHGIGTFTITGYGGGGAMAILLAAWRDDVTGIRTVAAKLDASMKDSLNPRDIAPRVARIPQYHFVGGRDPDVTPSVLRTFAAAIPKAKHECLSGGVVHDVGTDADWVEQWPQLLSAPLSCQKDTLQ